MNTSGPDPSSATPLHSDGSGRQARFSSGFAGWLAMVGVAVGLGNIWRFPYMMGSYGGSAFLLLYLLFALALAAPLLSAEWGLGRATGSGPIGAYRRVLGHRTGTALGLVLVISMLIANSYYLVVIAQIVYSAGFAITPGYAAEHIDHYRAGLGNGIGQYGIALILLGLAGWVLWRGVRRGIEAVSRVLVPVFGLAMLGLVGFALSLDGALDRLADFLRPDFSRLGPTEVFAALGQAFFSIGVGGTIMIAYGRFLGPSISLPKTAVATALGDTAAALAAALFLVPAVLHFGLDLDSGPGLLFDTLPRVFSEMPFGNGVAVVFLAAVTLVAFLSALAALTVCASGVADLWPRLSESNRAIALVVLLEALLIWPSAHDPALIGILDLIFGSGMQIFGALVAVIAFAWALDRTNALTQAGITGRAGLVWRFWLRYAIPAVLFLVLALYAHAHVFDPGVTP
ncbi:MAG TPA: hypothetical protein DDZ76_07120 [Xanthomonadales bacterium]|nr:hypothetical protein [Xanthomonadales bacterium]